MIHLRFVRGLIEAAEVLAAVGTEAGNRRAVSSAYYAVFHALCYTCADEFVGWNRPWPMFEPIYRSLDHGNTRDRLDASPEHDIKQIGALFRDLQQRRHTADYDPKPFGYGRQETLELIGQAHQAVDLIEALDSERRLTLSILLIARPSRGDKRSRQT